MKTFDQDMNVKSKDSSPTQYGTNQRAKVLD